jgi:AcrR family transcriptional regulator
MERRSVTTVARRAQIVAATIEVLAETGYRDTSFARIAEHAGLSSTRLISYHFASKGDLIAAVVTQVVEQMAAEVGGRVQAAPDAAARLAAYIEGVVGFTAAHRAPVRALLEIFLAGGLNYNTETVRESAGAVAAILRDGQATGQFRRDFDPRVIATAVQRAVEGVVFALGAEPELDSAGYARELVTLFRLGTSAGAGGS